MHTDLKWYLRLTEQYSYVEKIGENRLNFNDDII